MNDERDDLVVLVDEDGEESQFEYLDIIEYEDDEYAVLLPVVQEDGDEGRVIILKIVEDSDGEESLLSVEDNDVLEAVFERYKERASEEYDFDED
ncbi:MAG: DUF1292 domain-containing protein [Clostridium sp.]|nr:DUF1292 domain-containing protein [Clostridium sp.]